MTAIDRETIDEGERRLEERERLRWEGSGLLNAYVNAKVAYEIAGRTPEGGTALYQPMIDAKRAFTKFMHAQIDDAHPVEDEVKDAVNDRIADQSAGRLRDPAASGPRDHYDSGRGYY